MARFVYNSAMNKQMEKWVAAGEQDKVDKAKALININTIDAKETNVPELVHPSFMEYFAAVNLKDRNMEEVLRFSDEINWEEIRCW